MTKFDPHLFFNPVSKRNFDPPPLLSTPHLQKISTPHLHFDNSITDRMFVYAPWEWRPVIVSMMLGVASITDKIRDVKMSD